MAKSDKTIQMELETLMDEYSSNPNYRDIPYNLIPPFLACKLWKHQLQGIYSACKAEAAPPITNKKGEIFYSRCGLICPSTGTGKTNIALGIANFDVPEPIFKDTVITTSLNVVSLKPKELPMIQCTIICTSAKVLNNAWKRDIKIFYPTLPYYCFETVGKFEKEVDSSFDYQNKATEFNQIKNYIGNVYNNYINKTITQEQFEISMSNFGEFKTKEDLEEYNKKLNKDLSDYRNELIDAKLKSILDSVKVFFVTKDSFWFLFRLFDKYRISRFFYDEPQNTTLTKQDLFGNMKKDPRVEKIRKARGRDNSYAESNPFGFIWYVSATPQLISDNVDAHYFNGWVSKNDFLINDYSNNTEENRLFPELIQQYVIKFPYSYCLESNPKLMSLRKDFKLMCKTNTESRILRGVLGEDIDQLLENDDYEGVVDKLGIDGGNVNSILDVAIQRLQININKHKAKIQMYDVKTPKHVRDKSIEELNKEIQHLDDLKKKVARFYGNYSQDQCSICSEELQIIPTTDIDPAKRCCVHMSCMNVFHVGCIGNLIKNGQNENCPICRKDLKIEDLKLTIDYNGNNINNQVAADNYNKNNQIKDYTIDVNKEYESKIDALMSSLGPMERISNQNGERIWCRRQKVLLFVDAKSENSTKFNEIIHLCQDQGFNVRLPYKVGTIAVLAEKFPIRNGCRVEQPRSTDINKEIDNFMNDGLPWVWFSRSIKDSAGMNFPGCDTLIMYSPFKSLAQIIGRVMRMNRELPVDIFLLEYIK
jgi:hypothetical protein